LPDAVPAAATDGASSERPSVATAPSGPGPRPDAATVRDASDTLRFGLSIGTDFTTGSVRLAVGHRQLWSSGIEWRNAIEVGRIQRLATDLFIPVGPTSVVAAVPYAEASRQGLPLYVRERKVTEGLVERFTVGLDAAAQVDGIGELRVGPTIERSRVGLGENGLLDVVNRTFIETPAELLTVAGLRMRLRRDTLDAAFLPRSGSRIVFEWTNGFGAGTQQARYQFGAIEAQWVGSLGPDTFEAYAQTSGYRGTSTLFPRWSTLGGFHRLSGYALDRFSGTELAFGRLQWRRALGEPGALGGRLWAGATLEAGRITGDLLRIDETRTPTPIASSVFVAAETPVGPLHLGLGLPREGGPRMYLFLGRP
jgi:NTE family protein